MWKCIVSFPITLPCSTDCDIGKRSSIVQELVEEYFSFFPRKIVYYFCLFIRDLKGRFK